MGPYPPQMICMTVRNRRREKGDRIDDLRVDVNQRFAEHREDLNARFAEYREDLNRRFDEQRADSERRFAAILDEIKGLETRLTGELKAQGERIDRVYDVLRARRSP